MRNYFKLASSCIAFLFASAAYGQEIGGYTTLDVDPATNIVTATCETSDYSGYYASFVGCNVTDASGNQIAFGDNLDYDGWEGYTQIVLTFTGTPGTTYVATGSHSAQSALISDVPIYIPGRGGYGWNEYYYDFYNYSSFAEGGVQTYP